MAAALLAACMVSTSGAQTAPPYPPITLPLKLDQVPGKPVWYSTGNPGIPGKDNEGNTSNAGFVVTSDGVVVFDALGTPSLGWALLQEIRKLTDKKIRYVVASHYHADHIYGLQALRDHTDALIIAQERSGEYKDNEGIADEKASQRLDQRRGALFPWVDGNTRVVPPDITFRERMTIVLGDRRLTLFFAGPAHSSSDMMMMVEPDGVLFAGDIVQNSRIPFMNSDDVSTAQWLDVLGEVEKLDPKFIIPGHGSPSTGATQASAFGRE
jgi:glyoxylase-like metal-dependent hydrolase (beta-lactamase superfamily II)